jgi:hypothetical protein
MQGTAKNVMKCHEMSGSGQNLTRRQQRAMAALLGESTIDAAADQAGVTKRTVCRWLAEDEAFRTAYRSARRQVVDHAIGHIQQAAGEAVSTLRGIMADAGKPASARVAASRIVLELAVRAVELDDIQERLESLERELEALSANGRT